MIDSTKGLDFTDGDKELYADLLSSFVEDNSFDLEYFTNLINADKIDEAANYIHRIKGSAFQVGADSVGEKAREIENILRGKEAGNLPKEKYAVQKTVGFAELFSQAKNEALSLKNSLLK